MFQDRRAARVISRLSFVVLLAAGIPLSAAETAEPWEAGPFAADPAEMIRAASGIEAGSGEGGVLILFSERRYSFDEQGRATRVRRLVYRILNSSADPEWSEVKEPWSPWYQERPQLRARVVTPDGAAHVLDPATIAESATSQEPEMFEDRRILRAPLPATGPGAVIETEISGRDTAPFFDRGTVELLPVRFWIPIRHLRAIVEAPASLPLRGAVRRLPEEGMREEVADGRRRLTFEYRGLSPLEDIEIGMPIEALFSYAGFSTASSWSAVAQGYAEIVEEAIRQSGSNGALRAFLRSAHVPAKTPRESLDRILARLGSEVRYTGVELGAGSIIPRPPAETLRRKFGDCKDKAVLLTALLRELEIPAHVVLLAAGERYLDVEESLPGMGAFNHAIVVVPGEPDIWIDPTDRYARAGELPAGDQGKLALIASSETQGLVRTPAATAADNHAIETREIFLADLGRARVVETTEVRGAAERDLRATYADEDAKSLRESLTEYVSSAYMADKVGKIDHSDPADLSGPFRLTLEVEETQRALTDLDNATVAVFPGAALARLPVELRTEPDEKKPRQAAYDVTRPFISELRYRIVPPAGFRPQPLPPGRVRQLGPASLSEEYASADDGTVTANMRFTLDKRSLSAEEFEALRKSASAAWTEDGVILSFKHVGEAHLAAGRVREALDELGRLADQSPKKALPRLRIARALLAGGMGELAREEAKRAVELEPSVAQAWRDLGWVLVHDPVGRLFAEGFDRAGALAAFRKAKELDPKDVYGRRNLAVLQEYDAKGKRYSKDADLAAAIDEYRALKADLDESSLDDNLAIDLLKAERFKELTELVDSLEATSQRKTLRLAAVAAVDGAEAAAQEAERGFSEAEARRNALEEAAGLLVQARRYAEAAALFERAGSQADAAGLLRTEILRKTRRHEELTFPSNEPASMAKRLFLLPASGSPDPQALLALCSRSIRETIGKDEKSLKNLSEILLSPTGSLDDADTPIDMLLDMGLAAIRETVTGDDALGYRVGLSLAFSDQEIVYYLVREDGEYKLAGVRQALRTLGVEALFRLERGDLAGARQWLDWAREELQNVGGEDPLASPPFVTLWTRGAAGSADEARCAAAGLLAGTEGSEKAVPILLSCRDAAPEGERRTAIDLAHALSYWQLKRYAEMAEAAQRLAVAAPGSLRAFELLNMAFVRLGRWDEMRRIAEQRLATMADDPDAIGILYDAAQKQGNLDEAEKLLQRLVDNGKADATTFNNLAWLALFRGKVGDQAVEHAQRAAMLDEYERASSLHTLATLYAELGKTSEAYKVIVQALDLKSGAPEPFDWYVFGRLAEHYGLPEVARRYYERVTPPEPEESDFLSTYKLARQRLAALGPEVKESKRARYR